MCALAYSDLNYDTVQSLAARVNAAGCKFIQLPPKLTQLKSTKPVIAVCATRTGTGKSQTTRFIADFLKRQGRKIAVVRHPMPYDQGALLYYMLLIFFILNVFLLAFDSNIILLFYLLAVLLNQRCQRYEVLDDLVKYRCTIEEREEYELHIEEGNLLFAGVDYEMILRQAEKEADVVLWDGGNNDYSFFKPDLTICIADALREGHEEHFFPGEINMRMADLIMINKVNSLPGIEQAMKQVGQIRKLVKHDVPILLGNSVVTPEARDSTGALLDAQIVNDMVHGKRVLVIDDGPTLTHGGMPFGAGYVLANQMGAAEIVDPHPFAKGSLKGVFQKFPHLVNCLPAMGYGEEQIKDLQDTVKSVDCDCVIAGTPINLESVITFDKPCVRARYCLQLEDRYMGEMTTALAPFVSK